MTVASTWTSGSDRARRRGGRRHGSSSSMPTRCGGTMQLNSEFSELLSLLAQHRVKYLIVGGWAVVIHAEPRYTKDIDIFVEPSAENCRRLQRALEAFAGPLPELGLADLMDPRRVIMMGRPPTRIDLEVDRWGSVCNGVEESYARQVRRSERERDLTARLDSKQTRCWSAERSIGCGGADPSEMMHDQAWPRRQVSLAPSCTKKRRSVPCSVRSKVSVALPRVHSSTKRAPRPLPRCTRSISH